jgi:hypothetical protein
MNQPSGEIDIDDYQRFILKDINFEAFRVVADEVGEKEVREAFKPHMINSGAAVVINVQKELGITITGIESFIHVMKFAIQALWLAPEGEIVLTASGFECRFHDGCYMASAPPLVRRMFCEDTAPGVLMSYPDFGICKRCFDYGDRECAFIYYNRADPSAEWKNRGGTDRLLPILRYDVRKLREYGALALGELWLFPTQALIEWKGTEAMTKLGDAMRPLGGKWGSIIAKAMGADGKDLDSLLSIIDTFDIVMGRETRTNYSGPIKQESDITHCAFSVSFGEMGADCGKAIGMQCESFCNGICEAINKDFELRFTSMMCAGGQTCHRVIRKKLSARVAGE